MHLSIKAFPLNEREQRNEQKKVLFLPQAKIKRKTKNKY